MEVAVWSVYIIEKVLWAGFAEVVKQYWVRTVTKPKKSFNSDYILFIISAKNPDQTGGAYNQLYSSKNSIAIIKTKVRKQTWKHGNISQSWY